MFCKNCGNLLEKGDAFCGKCGTKVGSLSVSEQMGSVIGEVKPELKRNESGPSSWRNTASIVLGVVTLVLVFIAQILTMPFSLVGLILGFSARKKDAKYKLGIVLNAISFALAVPVFLFYSQVLHLSSANPVAGTWNCKSSISSSDYVVTMRLEEDGVFRWEKYDDAENNYVDGGYEYTDLHKTNAGENAKYYQVTLTGDEYVVNGQLQDDLYKSTYEMGISDNSDEAVIMNVVTSNLYFCERNK